MDRRGILRGEKTRAGNTWSEAKFWSFIRSNLRKMSMKWPPIRDAKKAARRKSQSENKRLKWEYQCFECRGWFPDKQTQVDHLEPCGSVKSFSQASEFLRRLLCEVESLRVVCKACHQVKTNEERTK